VKKLARRISGLLMVLGMTVGLWLAYEVAGRPRPAEPPAPTHQSAFRTLTVHDPYQPDAIYMADRAPTGGKPVRARGTFTPQAAAVYCVYELPRVRPEAKIEGVLRRAGIPVERRPGTPVKGKCARGYVGFTTAAGRPFPLGIYEVFLMLPGLESPVADVSFEVVPAEETQPPPASTSNMSVRNPTVALAVDTDGRPVSPLKRFPRAARRLVLCFEFSGAEQNQVLTCEWACDHKLLTQGTSQITLTASAGRAYAWIETGLRDPLPLGKYEALVRDGPLVLGRAQFEIAP
jgi:hypothetical protein